MMMMVPTDRYMPPLNARSCLSIDRTSFLKAFFSVLLKVDLSIDFISSNRLIRICDSAAWLELMVLKESGAAFNSFGMSVKDKLAVNRQIINFFIFLVLGFIYFMILSPLITRSNTAITAITRRT
jgi:hypothetical protein